ncbi:MAG: sigma 54-interacting transcriptional regulator [Proteobacteria bacterium]|nr:sigma 54-interacting transcriptional regulator [Pseudomonadota bacterium]
MKKPVLPHIDGLLRNPLDFIHLLDEIPLGILVLDKNLRVVHLNRAFEAMSGVSIARAVGTHCRHILRSSACVSNCPVLAMNSKKSALSCESDMINMDRQKLPIRITAAPLVNIDGQTTGFIETIEDMRMVENLDQKKSVAYSFANIIGRSPQMEKIFQTLPVLAQSDASILITGETGTGKDLVAEAIHQTSDRASGPFIKINCGALPETLLESEIFGHQKGAFTGAVDNKPGRFKLAHNGTIFLTEIGDLPLALQVKLLTFLDDKIIYPLGSTKGFNVNVRMITATHRNLEQMVKAGRFRKDLLFRLNVARIHLPPLREREGDIRLLLDYFFNHYNRQLGKKINGFSNAALARLLSYDYEGNIRELKNIVEYAVNVANDKKIEPENLPSYLFDPATQRAPVPLAREHSMDRIDKAAPLLSERNVSQGDKPIETWSSVQREMILDALKRAKGKKTEAAILLGWGRSTLWRKIKQHKIDL